MKRNLLMSRSDELRKGRVAKPEPTAPAEVSHDGDAPSAIVEATPSMAQYLEIKAANPDSLLWYRMGDFYELFFQDAVTASEALSIVLTKRGKHKGEDIPMFGVPVHRADEYLQRLIKQGHRVAVCEQLEDPAEARKRSSNATSFALSRPARSPKKHYWTPKPAIFSLPCFLRPLPRLTFHRLSRALPSRLSTSRQASSSCRSSPALICQAN